MINPKSIATTLTAYGRIIRKGKKARGEERGKTKKDERKVREKRGRLEEETEGMLNSSSGSGSSRRLTHKEKLVSGIFLLLFGKAVDSADVVYSRVVVPVP